jgi:hypothetical protein
VKIADLELGMMAGQAGLSAYEVAGGEDVPYYEDLPLSAQGSSGYAPPPAMVVVDGELDRESTASGVNSGYIAPMRSRDPECVNVTEILANWLAPEVINISFFIQFEEICVNMDSILTHSHFCCF